MAPTLAAGRILIIRPSALGDVCRTVPILTALRKAAPQAAIHWVVQSEFAEAIEAHPALDGVIEFPRSKFRGLATRPHRWAAVWSFFAGLRRGGFDVVLDCQGLARSGLMALATGASNRIVDRSAREGSWIFGTHRVRMESGLHEVDRMLALAKAAGTLPDGDITLHVPAAGTTAWVQRRQTLGLVGDFVVLGPATRWPSKAWPAGRWSALGRRLLEHDAALKLVLVGSPSETGVARSVVEGLREYDDRVIDCCGQTSIGELMAIIDDAALTIACDSAPLHMSAGLGGRFLGLYGPTDPAIVGPWRGEDRVIAAPRSDGEVFDYRSASLGDSVMRRIEIDTVATRAIEALGYGT